MKMKLKIVYKVKKTISVKMETEWIDEQFVDFLLADFQKTGRISEIIVIDEMGRVWSRKEYEKLKIKMEHEPVNPLIYFDGGFDKQTGTAGIGIVIYYEKGNATYRYRANAKLDEMENNNEAEYAALYNALMHWEEIGAKNLPIIIRGDSQGVLKQLEGDWPCYEKVLNAWLDRIETKISELNLKAQFEVISRRENKEADKLASQALENNIIQSHLKID
ncbi:reverse transcriptase-like protein [Lederbergia citrea]|uniref:reverse transcriptase-like protein n=1 Tax=Lederbergia citrea TaxID=2833581 RepID=UPI001BCA5824|nr:reverse transcriptase-like protein [Lederbergia citrea]MBS4203185.1 reverse transcriptase-like protein [Lederbergia citrea]